MIREKVDGTLKALPKALRNRLIAAARHVTAFLEAAPYGSEALPDALRGWLRSAARAKRRRPMSGTTSRCPRISQINVRVVDAAGRELAAGRDLAALRAQLGEAAQLSFAASRPGASSATGCKAWDFGDLPETLVDRAQQGQRLTGYPALVDDGDSVSLALLDTREAADAATRAGVVRLLRIALKRSARALRKGRRGLRAGGAAAEDGDPDGPAAAPTCSRRSATARSSATIRCRDPSRRSPSRSRRARTRLPAVAEGAFRLLAASPRRIRRSAQRLGAAPPRAIARVAAEVRRAADALVYPGFFAATPWAQLAHLPRYLTALDRRSPSTPSNPDRDARHSPSVGRGGERYRERRGARIARPAGRAAALESFRWSLEELRVSLFAQELKTPYPVSVKRARKGLDGTLSLTIGARMRCGVDCVRGRVRNLLLCKGIWQSVLRAERRPLHKVDVSRGRRAKRKFA